MTVSSDWWYFAPPEELAVGEILNPIPANGFGMAGKGTAGRRPDVSNEEILAVFDRTKDPVVTTAEIAAELPIGKQATLDRLEDIHDEGELARKSVGPGSQVWWRPIEIDGEPLFSDDPFLNAPTFESGKTDVSNRVDEKLAAALSEEADLD